MHLQLTSIVPPDDAELAYLFRVSCHEHGNAVIGMLYKNERFLKLQVNRCVMISCLTQASRLIDFVIKVGKNVLYIIAVEVPQFVHEMPDKNSCGTDRRAYNTTLKFIPLRDCSKCISVA